MTSLMDGLKRIGATAFLGGAILFSIQALATAQKPQKPAAVAPASSGPDLDLLIQHYSRVQTADGVLRESRYEEEMMRRPGHVWITRVLPKSSVENHQGHLRQNNAEDKHQATILSQAKLTEHKHFNPAVLTRHVIREGEKARLELINMPDREIVAVAPDDYESVNFDGSWANAFFLIDPQRIAALPPLERVTTLPDTTWKKQEKNGRFQYVLWDDKKMIPLIIEAGDLEGNVFERTEVKPRTNVSPVRPWLSTRGFTQKDYADFID